MHSPRRYVWLVATLAVEVSPTLVNAVGSKQITQLVPNVAAFTATLMLFCCTRFPQLVVDGDALALQQQTDDDFSYL